MRSILKILFLTAVALSIFSCSKDSQSGNKDEREFIVAFEEQSIPYGDIKDQAVISLLFSQTAQVEGSVELHVTMQDVVFDKDFSTIPSIGQGQVIVLPFSKGSNGVEFVFKNLDSDQEQSDKLVQFQIQNINYTAATPVIKGFNILTISYNASLGGVLAPNIGGPNEHNQVYVDLAGRATYPVLRDSWDLAFYSDGPEFVVKLNGSIYMAAGPLGVSSIDQVVSSSELQKLQELIRIGTFDSKNTAYIDSPSGDLNQTAIARIDPNDENNKVYLLNLGSAIGSDKDVLPGSVNIAGDARGWKKIRILQRGSDYLLQYAEPQQSQFKEILIPKRPGFNFNFFSFDTLGSVSVEPSKENWDLNFTVFTNTVSQNGAPMGSYGFSDFILQNRYAGVQAYMVRIPSDDKDFYKEFSLNQVDYANFSYDLRIIGDTWRDVASQRVVYKDVFYVLKDAKGNFYKFRMLGFTDEKGNRGYPRFEYSLLF